MAQTTYATMFILAVLTSFWNLTERRRKKERTFISTKLVGFAAGKKLEAQWNYKRDNFKESILMLHRLLI